MNGRLRGLLVPVVMVLSYPSNVSTGEHFVVTWNVTGGIPGKITHTAIHWGKAVGVSGMAGSKSLVKFKCEIYFNMRNHTFFNIWRVTDLLTRPRPYPSLVS